MESNKTADRKWWLPDEVGNIDVPDELMPLFNRVGTQIRFHTISGLSEVLATAHIVRDAQEYAAQQTEQLRKENAILTEVEDCNKRTILNQQQTIAELKTECASTSNTLAYCHKRMAECYKENASLRQQLSEREKVKDNLRWPVIASEHALQEAHKKHNATSNNGKSEFALAWRLSFQWARENYSLTPLGPSPSQEQLSERENCAFCGWPKNDHRNGRCYRYSDENTDYFYDDKFFQSPKEPSPKQVEQKPDFIRWTGCLRSFEEIKKVCPDVIDGGAVWYPYGPPQEPRTDSWPLFVGNEVAQIGDYFLKDVNGGFHPCSQDVYNKSVSPLHSRIKELEQQIEQWKGSLPHRALVTQNRVLEARIKELEAGNVKLPKP